MSTCHPSPAVIRVGAIAVQSKPHVRDIGIVLDDTMTMAKHVKPHLPCSVLSPSQYSQYKTFADYLCIQDTSPQPRHFAPGLWKCYSVRPFLWNKLPASVKNENSYGAFKTALKTHLFREAFMTLLCKLTGQSS